MFIGYFYINAYISHFSLFVIAWEYNKHKIYSNNNLYCSTYVNPGHKILPTHRWEGACSYKEKYTGTLSMVFAIGKLRQYHGKKSTMSLPYSLPKNYCTEVRFVKISAFQLQQDSITEIKKNVEMK